MGSIFGDGGVDGALADMQEEPNPVETPDTGLFHEIGQIGHMAAALPTGLLGMGADAVRTGVNASRLLMTAGGVAGGKLFGESDEQIRRDMDTPFARTFALGKEYNEGIAADPAATEGLGKVIPGIANLSSTTERLFPLVHGFGASANRTAGDVQDVPQYAAVRAVATRNMDPLTTDNRFVQAYQKGELAPKVIEDLANVSMVGAAGGKAISGSVARAGAEAEAAQAAVSTAKGTAQTAATNAGAKAAGEAVASGVAPEYAANLGAKTTQEALAEALAHPALQDLEAAAVKAETKAGRWQGAAKAMHDTAHLTGRGAMLPAKVWTAPGILTDTGGGRFGLFASKAAPAAEEAAVGGRAGLFASTDAGRAIPFGREGSRTGLVTYLKDRGFDQIRTTERGAALLDNAAAAWEKHALKSALHEVLHQGEQRSAIDQARIAKRAYKTSKTAGYAGRRLGVEGDVVSRAATVMDTESHRGLAEAIDTAPPELRRKYIEMTFENTDNPRLNADAFELAERIRKGDPTLDPQAVKWIDEIRDPVRGFNAVREVRGDRYFNQTGEKRAPNPATIAERQEQLGDGPMPSAVNRQVAPFEADIADIGQRIPGLQARADTAAAMADARAPGPYTATPRQFSSYDSALNRAGAKERAAASLEQRATAADAAAQDALGGVSRRAVEGTADSGDGLFSPVYRDEAVQRPEFTHRDNRAKAVELRAASVDAVDQELARVNGELEAFGVETIPVPPGFKWVPASKAGGRWVTKNGEQVWQAITGGEWRRDLSVPLEDLPQEWKSFVNEHGDSIDPNAQAAYKRGGRANFKAGKLAPEAQELLKSLDDTIPPERAAAYPGEMAEAHKLARGGHAGMEDPNADAMARGSEEMTADRAMSRWVELKQEQIALEKLKSGTTKGVHVLPDQLAARVEAETGYPADLVERAWGSRLHGPKAEAELAGLAESHWQTQVTPHEQLQAEVRGAQRAWEAAGEPAPWEQSFDDFSNRYDVLTAYAEHADDAVVLDAWNKIQGLDTIDPGLGKADLYEAWRKYAQAMGEEVPLRGPTADQLADRAVAGAMETAIDAFEGDLEVRQSFAQSGQKVTGKDLYYKDLEPAEQKFYRKLAAEAKLSSTEEAIAGAKQLVEDRRQMLAEMFGKKGERAGRAAGRLEQRAKDADSVLTREQKRLTKAEAARDQALLDAEASPQNLPARFAEATRMRTEGGRAARELAVEHPEHADLFMGLAEDLEKNGAADIAGLFVNPRHIISGEQHLFGTGKHEVSGTRETGTSVEKSRTVQTGTDYSLPGQARREIARARTSALNDTARQVETKIAVTPNKLGLEGTSDEIAAEMARRDMVRWDAENRRSPKGPVTGDSTFLPRYLLKATESVLNEGSPGMRLFQKYYDRAFMGRVKMWQLGLSPKWLVGNVFGNAFMAMAGGGITPAQYYRGIQNARRLFAEEPAMGTLEDGTRFEKAWGAHKQRLFDQGEGLRARGMEIPEELTRGFTATETDFLSPELGDKRNLVRRAAGKGFAANEYTDNVSRAAIYLAKLEPRQALWDRMNAGGPGAAEAAAKLAETKTGQQALAEAMRAAGDFSKMTPFEQNVVRRAVPFYAWYRHITKLTLGLPVYAPARTVWMLHLADVFGGNIDNSADDARGLGAGTRHQSTLPPFLQGSISAGDTEIGLGGMNPFNQGVESPIFSAEGAAGALTPGIRWPIALFAGKDLSHGFRDITRAPGTMDLDEYGREKYTPLIKDPGAAATYLGKQFPIGRVGDKLFGENIMRYDTGDPMLSHGQVIESSSPGGAKGAAMQLFGVPYAQVPDQEQFDRTRTKRELAAWKARRKYQAQLAASSG